MFPLCSESGCRGEVSEERLFLHPRDFAMAHLSNGANVRLVAIERPWRVHPSLQGHPREHQFRVPLTAGTTVLVVAIGTIGSG